MDKITVVWSKERANLILVTYNTNDWQWSDFAHAFDEQRALLEKSDLPAVHILVDVRKSQLMPSGGSLLSASRNLSRDVHPRQGHTIIVGAKGLLATILDATTRMIGANRSKIHTATTIEEAYRLLDQLAV